MARCNLKGPGKRKRERKLGDKTLKKKTERSSVAGYRGRGPGAKEGDQEPRMRTGSRNWKGRENIFSLSTRRREQCPGDALMLFSETCIGILSYRAVQ